MAVTWSGLPPSITTGSTISIVPPFAAHRLVVRLLRWRTNIRSASRSSMRNDLGYAETLFAVPARIAHRRHWCARRAADHPGHEQNASTSAMRLVGSTRAANRRGSRGPPHGGANEAVLETLEEISARSVSPRCCAAPDKTTCSASPGSAPRLQEADPPCQGIAAALPRSAGGPRLRRPAPDAGHGVGAGRAG